MANPPLIVTQAGGADEAPKGAIPVDFYGVEGGDISVSFSDITGTATASQIPSLNISKISGLQAILDDYEARLAALEAAGA